ncbi:hypothetical protein [Chryseobacterium carnipullorum]|uniref:Uncharacterized protein n=1 Tax=Chryseobacterium carnipullorum TaxID=1124835 RepID=A0A1M6ZCX2_CHRCU|nr:hypothetical protein [Chryseobacterium carnipullorum]SHL28332.1 hypothetical protein SAMN05444360_10119 [Chryseobacterium carnipullorum]STD11394.1 Uncharacterised protein [Chryseobacterium carnipullorum]
MKNKNLSNSISIVELEERFETSVVSLDAERCSRNTADVRLEASAL